MNDSFRFKKNAQAMRWTGRYLRIPGREPAFHADVGGKVTAQWFDKEASERLAARIRPSPDAERLGKAVNAIKEQLSGHAGGSFLINEFGAVICPIQGRPERYHVGTISGIPEFIDPRTPGNTFTLKPANDMAPGAPWGLPYIGMRFNLRSDDVIYFKMDDEDGERQVCAKRQDAALIRTLRVVRPGNQPVRFMVNLHGAVLTKIPPDSIPVFVGYIRHDYWFSKGGLE